MLVSATARTDLRREVAAGHRPMPEFLALEQGHGVRLLDWGDRRGRRKVHRSPGRSLAHVAKALPRVRGASAVLSDGEHVGIPLALAMLALRVDTPHVVIAHHLATPTKARAFRWSGAGRRVDRLLVHSPAQRRRVIEELRIDESLVHVLGYGVDTAFWCPQGQQESTDLVFAAGAEHRDYECLVEACPESARLFVTAQSASSPGARRREPLQWPSSVRRVSPSWVEMRRLYDEATVVVVPLLPTDFPAGVTALLEAMSMGKAVVVSATEGLEGVVDDRAIVKVRPGDARHLREAIGRLLDDPAERHRLGHVARGLAVDRHGVDKYAEGLACHLAAISCRGQGSEASFS